MPPPRRESPPPLETDDVRIIAVGTGLWLAAFALLGVAWLAGAAVPPDWLATCAVGAGLGVIGIVYCRRRRSRLRQESGAAGQ